MKKNYKKKKKQDLEQKSFPNWKLASRYSIYIVILITIAALVARAYRVGYLTVWLDEYMHINPALDIIKGNEINQADKNGIFLTWLIAAFFKIFGISAGVARIPSVILGTATIPFIYIFAKKLYNNSIGITASFLYAFSLYVICWSRLARNYASFGFAYILLLIVIWLIFNSVSKSGSKENFFTRNGLNTKYLILFPFAFLFSFLNHQLTFFILFGLSFYIIYKAIDKIFKREAKPFTNIYSILAYFIIAGLIVFITPGLLDKIARPILGIFLSERIINWVLPDWSVIATKFSDPIVRFKSFMIYFNVIKNDFTYLYYLGIAGIIASFFIPKKKDAAVYLFSMFIIPFLLMSFVFREPSTPNYLYYIYPIFLIYIAIFIYVVVKRILPLIVSKNILYKKWFSNFCLIVIFIGLIITVPKQEIKSLLTNKTHGQVVKKELFHSSFTNWKDLAKQLKKYVRKQDVVISTWPDATNFYFKRNNSIWFRQRRYDVIQKKFVNRESTGAKNSAYTLEELINTYKENKTGWLFADFYFDNVLTDPRARDFVIKNMDYYFNLSKNGDIKVFSWDHNRPNKQKNTVIIDLGKNSRKMVSKELKFNLQNINAVKKGITLIIEAEGIDTKNEAYIGINAKNHAIFKTTNSYKRQVYKVFLQKSWLKQGQNTMQFYYNKDIIDFPKGYVIYNIRFLNQ